MSRTACSSRAPATASPRGWRNTSRRWRGPAWAPASTDCSSRGMKSRRARRATGRRPCGSIWSSRSSANWCKSMPSSEPREPRAVLTDLSLARKVLPTEAAAIIGLIDRLDERFARAVELLRECRGGVIVTGMGKSGIIARKIAATLASTATPAFFLHPAEAIHGDLGVLQGEDVIVALSYSGETDELLRLLETIKRLGARLIAVTGHRASTLARAADVALDCSVSEEACPMNLVPTASTTAALALGDAMAMALLVAKGFRQEDFANLHPGGKLGKQLMRAEQLM